MTIAHAGATGTATGSTSASTLALATSTNAYAVNDFGILRVGTDNLAAVTGVSTDHTGISGWTGSVLKLGEYTFSPSGVAGDGATISLWALDAAAAIATGTSLTINFSGACVDKVAALNRYTKAAGMGVRLAAGTTALTGSAAASASPGSLGFSGLTSAARTYLRAIANEANSATTLTPTTSFTAWLTQRSRNSATLAMSLSGEFRTSVTSAGEVSNPTLASAGDNASLFVAIEEYTPSGIYIGTRTRAQTYLGSRTDAQLYKGNRALVW